MTARAIRLIPYDWPASLDRLHAEFIDETWRDAYAGETMIDMSPQWLRWLYDPRTDIAVTIRDGERGIGFFGAAKRRGRVAGENRDVYLGTMFSVHPAYQGRGLGTRLLAALAEAVLDGHPERLLLFYMDVGHASLGALRKYLGTGRYPLLLNRPFQYRAKVLDMRRVAEAEPLRGAERLLLCPLVRHWFETVPPSPGVPGRVRPYAPGDLDACLNVLGDFARDDGMGLVQTFSPEALARQLAFEDYARTWVYERDGTVQGLLNFYLPIMRGPKPFPGALVNLANWRRLAKAEQCALMGGVLNDLQRLGRTALIANMLVPNPDAPFRWARAVTHPRKSHQLVLGHPADRERLAAAAERPCLFEHK